jgi:hypothetical protein
MAEIHFTSHLRNFVPQGPLPASGATVNDSGSRLAMGSTTGALWTSDDGGEHWQLVNADLPPIYAVRFI